MTTTCDNGDGKAAFCKGLCRACYMCVRRNGSTVRKKPECGTRYEDAEEMLAEAIINLKDAPDKARAHRRYLMAHLRYCRRRNTVKNTTEYSP